MSQARAQAGKAVPAHDPGFSALCDLLPGTWAGERNSDILKGERVQAIWERFLEGAFLREHWFTSGEKRELSLHAMACFKILDETPADFFVAYRGGKVAHGASVFRGEWILSHHWMDDAQIAEIRVKLLDADTYSQEVHVIGPGGDLQLLSTSILVRQGVHAKGSGK